MQRAGVWFVGCAVAASLLTPRGARAALIDARFVEQPFASVENGMTGMAWAPDGSNRLFLSDQAGDVTIVQNGTVLIERFVNISPILAGGELGLTGMAFGPNFAQNGYVYFFVTVSATEQQIIRYRADGNVGVEKTIIVPGLPTAAANHDGGALGFGPDGKLYFAIGDLGGGVGVDADLGSLASKVGRANPDGSAPSDNPFFDGDGPNNDYIWARGFRNPFTLSFEPSGERLWLNVVGTSFEQIFTPRPGDHGGWNDYENNQPSGFISPIVAYQTNASRTINISPTGAVRSGGVATFTMTGSDAHGLRPGGRVTIAGVTDPSFNGSAFVKTVPSLTQFSIDGAGPDATSGGGTASTLDIGGCITGGAFWDSSAVPASHRGDFFFGDFNSGRIVRVELGASAEVSSVDDFGQLAGSLVDFALGPDGNLYYLTFEGQVYRASFGTVTGPVTPALIVSPLHQRISEGGESVFHVRLTVAPTSAVVRTARVAGSENVTIVEGAELEFDSSNWSLPQVVRVAAAADSDVDDDEATLRVSAGSLPTQDVLVRVTDDRVPGTGGNGGAGGEAGGGEGGARAGEGGAQAGEPGMQGGEAGASGGSAGEGGRAGIGGAGSAGMAGEDDSGCGCRTPGSDGSNAVGWLGAAALLGALRLRARRRRASYSAFPGTTAKSAEPSMGFPARKASSTGSSSDSNASPPQK